MIVVGLCSGLGGALEKKDPVRLYRNGVFLLVTVEPLALVCGVRSVYRALFHMSKTDPPQNQKSSPPQSRAVFANRYILSGGYAVAVGVGAVIDRSFPVQRQRQFAKFAHNAIKIAQISGYPNADNARALHRVYPVPAGPQGVLFTAHQIPILFDNTPTHVKRFQIRI